MRSTRIIRLNCLLNKRGRSTVGGEKVVVLIFKHTVTDMKPAPGHSSAVQHLHIHKVKKLYPYPAYQSLWWRV